MKKSKQTTPYWDGDVYYLKDGQWIKHAGTYGEMVMGFPTGCVLHESTKGITTEKINGKCVTKGARTPLSRRWEGSLLPFFPYLIF